MEKINSIARRRMESQIDAIASDQADSHSRVLEDFYAYVDDTTPKQHPVYSQILLGVLVLLVAIALVVGSYLATKRLLLAMTSDKEATTDCFDVNAADVEPCNPICGAVTPDSENEAHEEYVRMPADPDKSKGKEIV